MWVYAVKAHLETGKYKRVRSRITLMGNREKALNIISGLDAYAPVAQAVTGRLLIAMHLHIALVVFRQLDVSNAYINEYMRRKVICGIPPGYKPVKQPNGRYIFIRLGKGEKPPSLAFTLIMALYGGSDAGRIFYEAWLIWHLENGFESIHEDRCFLMKRSKDNNSWIKLAYHVDDNMIAYVGAEFYQEYLETLKTRFDFTEGPLHEHLS